MRIANKAGHLTIVVVPVAMLCDTREDLRYLSGSFGGEMAGKIVELRAALLVQGAVRLVHPGTERKAHIRAMPSSKRGFR